MRDWPFRQRQIRVLSAMLGFCREAFYIGQTGTTLSGVIFCSCYTISIAKRKDDRDPCSHFLNILAHAPQQIYGAQDLSLSQTLQPNYNS
jgi:hypothetical protein